MLYYFLHHARVVAKAAIVKTGFELVEHPLYSPDLAPNDLRPFPRLREKVFSVSKFSGYFPTAATSRVAMKYQTVR